MTWHLALEHQMDAHRFYSSERGKQVAYGFFVSLFGDFLTKEKGHSTEEVASSIKQIGNYLSAALYQADTMSVSPEMHQVVMRAAMDYDGPLFIPPEQLLTPHGFVHLQEAIVGEDSAGKVCTCHAFAWTRHMTVPDLVYFYFLTDSLDERDEVSRELRETSIAEIKGLDPGFHPSRFELSHWLPVYLTGEEQHTFTHDTFDIQGGFMVEACLKYWIALNIISHQTVGQVEKLAPPRATSKRAKLWDPERGSRYISLITLRRKKGKHNEEPKNVPYSHRWVVSGHWRKQWYPSEGVHRYKYIYEYVKGPENKPLIVRERRVFNLVR